MARFAIVDDEYFFRQSLKRMLEESTLPIECVGEANNGESGLELIRETRPDFVIVDINMPVMSGLDMIKQCLSEKICDHFILLTGYAEFAYAKQAINMGVDDYILKPINETELLHTIEHTLESITETALREHSTQRVQLNFLFQNCLLTWNEGEMEKLSSYTGGWTHPFFRCVVLCWEKGTEGKLPDFPALAEKFILQRFHYFPDRVCCLLNYADESDFKLFFEQLGHEVSDAGLKMGAGQRYELLKDAHHSYYQAVFAADYAEPGNFLCYEDLIAENSSQRSLSSCRQLAIAAISSGESNKVTEFFDRLEQTPESFQLGYRDLLMALILIYIDMKPMVDKYQLDKFNDFYTEIPAYIARTRPFADIFKKLREMAITCCYAVAGAKGQNDYIKEILEYLQAHYQESDLSVSSLAKHFSLNYGYMCTMFKKCLGITINSYITNIRLEKAKGAFDAGAVNISQTAAAVGYTDPSYFCKCFKKKYGVSPQRYIDNLV